MPAHANDSALQDSFDFGRIKIGALFSSTASETMCNVCWIES
jgi:hypothetical protein